MRLEYLDIRMARLRLTVITILTLLAIWSATHLTINASLIALMDRPSFSEELLSNKEAMSSLEDWESPPEVLLITSDDPERLLSSLSDLVLELQFMDGAPQVVSPFSLRGRDGAPNAIEAGMLADVPAREILRIARETLLFGEQFISEDQNAVILLVSGEAPVLREIGQLYDECAAGSDLCVRAIGMETMERKIGQVLLKDNQILPALSALFSFLIIAFWFSSLRSAALLVTPPFIGLAWYVGLMAALDIPLDVFNTMVPPIMLAIGLADMLHLKRAQEITRSDAAHGFWGPLKPVLVPITITTVTTGIAFAAMAFGGNEMIRRLALCGVLGVSTLWAAVVICGPIFLPPMSKNASGTPGTRLSLFLLEKCYGILSRRRAVTLVAGVLFAAGLAVTALTPVDYQFDEDLPASKPFEAYHIASAQGLAMAPALVVLPNAAEEVAADVARQLYGVETITKEELSGAAVSPDAFVFPVPMETGIKALEMRAYVETVKAQAPEGTILDVAGYPVNAAETVLGTINRLQIVLGACCLLIAVIMGVVMRSAFLGAVTLFVNLLPLFAIQGVVAFAPGWVSIMSTVSMIVASGIVVDDTSHLLWASRRRGPRSMSIWEGLHHSFEPITLTSICLIAGFGVLIFAELPGLKMMGGCVALALLVAWIADVILLPALLSKKETR